MSRMLCAATLIAFAALGASPIAQDSTAARSKATELSRSWAAIGQGDYARAEQIAAALLRANPSDHSAIAVGVAATAGAGKPIPALDLYEEWLRRTRHEDVFLLQPIATGILAAIAGGDDLGLAVEALSNLAASDPDAARGVLDKRTDAGPEFDRVRAELGDKAAVTRLVDNLGAPTSREKLMALQALAGVADIPPPRSLLYCRIPRRRSGPPRPRHSAACRAPPPSSRSSCCWRIPMRTCGPAPPSRSAGLAMPPGSTP